MHPDILFPTKQYLNILNELGQRILGHKIKKIENREKTKKIFCFLKKSLFFKQLITQAIKIFSQKGCFGYNIILFLKDPKMGCLPTYSSQFRNFGRKFTFFKGVGRVLKPWHGVLSNVIHTLYHRCSFVRIFTSFQYLLKVFLQDSQRRLEARHHDGAFARFLDIPWHHEDVDAPSSPINI